MRRSHHAIKSFVFATCVHCGATVRPHRACSTCGHYQGRLYQEIVKLPKEKKKKDKDQDE